MVYFKEQNCGIVVLEVGLGGRLDSTNIIPAPEVAVITNLGLEHTDQLGDTIPLIAKEKAGIIKPGCRCVLYHQSREAEEVVEEASSACWPSSAASITLPMVRPSSTLLPAMYS